MKTGCLLESPAGRAEVARNLRLAVLLLAALICLCTSVGCGRKGGTLSGYNIEVRVMADDGCAFRWGRVYGEILRGENPETAEQVNRWESLRTPSTLELLGKTFALPEIAQRVVNLGGETTTLSVPGPGVYWVRVTAASWVRDTEYVSIRARAGEMPEEAAERCGWIKDMPCANPDDRGPPGKIIQVTDFAVPTGTDPKKTSNDYDVGLRVTREYCYVLPPTLVRTHVADHEQPDHVLAVVPASAPTIRNLHRTLKDMGGVKRHVTGDLTKALQDLRPVIGSTVDYTYPITNEYAKFGRGTAITIVTYAATHGGEVKLPDVAYDVVKGKIVTYLVGKLVTDPLERVFFGGLAGVAVSVFIDAAILSAEQAQFQDHGASDDYEVTSYGSLTTSLLGSMTGSGRVTVRNYGEPMYEAHVVALFVNQTDVKLPLEHRPLPATAGNSGSDRTDILSSDEWQFRWYAGERALSPASGFRGLALSYRTYPMGPMYERQDPKLGKSYEYCIPLELSGKEASVGPLRITGFSTQVLPSSQVTGREVRLFAVHVKNMGVEPAYLRLSTTDDDYRCSPEIIAEREAAGAKGPYRLGLEYRNQTKKNGPWELMSVLRASPGWTLLEKCEKDVHFFGSIVSQAYLDPGQTRTVALFSDDLEPTWRVFILRPTCARSDTKTIEEKDLAQ